MTDSGNPSGYQNAFGTEYGADLQSDAASAIADYSPANPTEGTYAGEYDLLNAVGVNSHGDPDVPADILTEEAGRFYTALPLDAFSKAAAPYTRVQTHILPAQGIQPLQILRKNPGRRKAQIIVQANGIDGPVFMSPNSADIQGLGQLGAYALLTAVRGPFMLLSGGNVGFGAQPTPMVYESTGDLWAVFPWTQTSAVMVSTVEYYDA